MNMFKYIVIIAAIVGGLFFISSCAKDGPEETLKKQMCEELFERDYTTISDRIKESLNALKPW